MFVPTWKLQELFCNVIWTGLIVEHIISTLNADLLVTFASYLLFRCRVVVGTDRNTQNLTYYLSESIYNMTGLRPYVIINQLHRSRLDANRHRDEAAFDDPVAGKFSGLQKSILFLN